MPGDGHMHQLFSGCCLPSLRRRCCKNGWVYFYPLHFTQEIAIPSFTAGTISGSVNFSCYVFLVIDDGALLLLVT